MKKTGVRESFFNAWNYIKESRNYIYFSIVLFVVSAVVGFVFPEYFRFFDSILEKLVDETSGLGLGSMILFILQNNLQASLMALVFGIALGIFPIFYAATNGLILGYVMNKVQMVAGISEFWRLLPHGIFELPAIFISFGLGIRLGFFVFSKKRGKEFKKRFYSSANSFLFIVVPLLIVAAIIEGFFIFFSK